MSRNLKALGLALVAALALGAIGAQGASAAENHEFTSTTLSTVLTGNSESNQTFRAGTGGADVSCTVASFSGTNVGEERDTVTVHPKYSSCTAFGVSATVNTDGCNAVLGSNTTTNPHFSSEHAPVSIECSEGHSAITVSAAGCTVSYFASYSGSPVNQSMHGLRYTNVTHSGKAAGTVNATVGSIHYVGEDSGGIACNLCGIGDGPKTNGIYTGASTVTG